MLIVTYDVVKILIWSKLGDMRKKVVIPKSLQSTYEKWHYAPAVESDGFLFVSGCTGTRNDGTNSPDAKEQFIQAFKNVELVLKEAGLTFNNVVDMPTYHVGLQGHLMVFSEVKDQFVKEPYPAWTAIGVVELAVPGAIIEIQVTAKL